MRVLIKEEVYTRLLPYSFLFNKNIKVYEEELFTPFCTIITDQPFKQEFDSLYNIVYLSDYIDSHVYQARYYPTSDLELAAFAVALSSCTEDYLLPDNKHNRIYFTIPDQSLNRYRNRYMRTLMDLKSRYEKSLKEEYNLIDDHFNYQPEVRSLIVEEPKPLQLSNQFLKVFEKEGETYIQLKQDGINYSARCEAVKRDTQNEVYQNVLNLRNSMKYFQTSKVNQFKLQNLQEDVKKYEMEMVENTPQYNYLMKNIQEDLSQIIQVLKQRLTLRQFSILFLLPLLIYAINLICALFTQDILDYVFLSILTLLVPVLSTAIYYWIVHHRIEENIISFNTKVLQNHTHYNLSEQISKYFTAIYNATKLNAIIDYTLDHDREIVLRKKIKELEDEILMIHSNIEIVDVPPFKIVENRIVMDDEQYPVISNTLKKYTTFLNDTRLEVE